MESIEKIWIDFCHNFSFLLSKESIRSEFEKAIYLLFYNLGWRDYKKEIKLKPIIQRYGKYIIEPDIALYGPKEDVKVIILFGSSFIKNIEKSLINNIKSYMMEIWMRLLRSS